MPESALFDRLRREYRDPGAMDIAEFSLRDLGTSPGSTVARDERKAKLALALSSISLDHQIAIELEPRLPGDDAPSGT